VVTEAAKAAAAAAVASTPAEVQAAAAEVQAAAKKMSGNSSIKLRLTAYYPLEAKTEAQKKMEGPPIDRKSKALNYLEDAVAGKADWCSVSGDYTAFPYGQLMYLDAFPGIKFRVVDTGKNFMGSSKVYRSVGLEPIDVAVRSSKTKVPAEVTGTIVRGDTLDKPGKDVAVSKFRGQAVVGSGLDMLGAC
jgi:hypothetical protein